MLKKGIFFLIFFFVISLFSSNVFARTRLVKFDAFTQNFDGNQYLEVYVEAQSETDFHPPDYIQTISIDAPDGTQLSLDPTEDWDPTSTSSYFKRFVASDFDGDVIPGGLYQCTVTDIDSKSFFINDWVPANFLQVATITTPTDNSTTGKVQWIMWTWPTGATHFRIYLYNESWGEPIYGWTPIKKYTNRNQFLIPKGVLKSGITYKVRIEARSNMQDLDQRSRSDWITFTVQ
jgi:hypothetical protein